MDLLLNHTFGTRDPLIELVKTGAAKTGHHAIIAHSNKRSITFKCSTPVTTTKTKSEKCTLLVKATFASNTKLWTVRAVQHSPHSPENIQQSINFSSNSAFDDTIIDCAYARDRYILKLSLEKRLKPKIIAQQLYTDVNKVYSVIRNYRKRVKRIMINGNHDEKSI
jgi:hypothetical protein